MGRAVSNRMMHATAKCLASCSTKESRAILHWMVQSAREGFTNHVR